VALILSPRLLRRGLEIFAVISMLGVGGLLLYGNNLNTFSEAMLSLRVGWLLLGVVLASMDWVGGGLRIWVLVRRLHPEVTLKGAIIAGGLNTWAGYLTPAQTGGGPMMIYALKRDGVPLPKAMIATLMSFVATIVFFAILGPLTFVLGAGRSLERYGILGKSVTLLDLYRLSLGTFITIGLGIIFLFVFPGSVRGLMRWLAGWLARRGKHVWAARVESAGAGIDHAHESLLAFLTPRGWLALGLAVVLTGLAMANRLLAGFVVLRMLGIRAQFVDVALLQTLIAFLLYFAPTPGGSGLAEILSAAVMSIYVPRALTPSYILLWRVITSYLTVALGSFIFWRWLKVAEENLSVAPSPGRE